MNQPIWTAKTKSNENPPQYFFTINKAKKIEEGTDYNLAYKSECQGERQSEDKKTYNIRWNRVLTDGNDMYGDNLNTPLMFQIFEFKKNDTKYDCIASFYENLDFVKINNQTGYEKCVQIKNGPKLTIKTSKFEELNSFSFLEYITGGCEIDLHVAINFNMTNGRPSGKSAKHSEHYQGT